MFRIQLPGIRPVDIRNLSLFRFLFCIFVCAAHIYFFHTHLAMYANGYIQPLFAEAVFSASGQLTLAYISGIGLIIFLFCSACGIYTRASLFASTLLFLVFQKPIIDMTGWHDAQLTFFTLLILCVAPGVSYVTVFSLKNAMRALPAPAWPKEMIILALALAYLFAGLNKLRIGGLQWADGGAVRELFFDFYTLHGYEIAYALLQHDWFTTLSAVLVLLFQNTFWIILFIPFLRPLYVLGGLTFHALIYITTGINFFPYFVITYFIFLKAEWIERTIRFLQNAIRKRQWAKQGA